MDSSAIAGPLIRATLATAIAVAGGATAAVASRAAARRLNLLVYTAMGILLAVTVADILPDAKSILTWPELLLAAASGAALFWLVSKYIYHICPVCAIHTFDDAAVQRLGQTVLLFMVALGIHSTMDGLAVVLGDEIVHGIDWSVLLAVCIHKLPEGMAVALLLIGAGYPRARAFWMTVGIEATTELGALIGVFTMRGLPPVWLGFIFGNVGGGFLYLVGTTLGAVKFLIPNTVHVGHGHEGHGHEAVIPPPETVEGHTAEEATRHPA